MSQGISSAGPHMNWTKDNKVYQRYLLWKSSAEEIFSSLLPKESEAEKCAYLHIWMGDDGYPLLMKWKAMGKLKFDHKEEIRNHLGRVTTPISSGYLLNTYWELLEKELRPNSKPFIHQMVNTPANSGRTCYRCKAPYARGHEKICKALKAKCGYCQEIGYYEKCCRKAGNFPKKQVHITSAVPTPTLTPASPAPSAPAQVPQEYWDEGGKLYKEVHMCSAPSKKDLLIQFDIGKEINSVNFKVILKIETGADVNALNRSTFKSLFPQVQLQPSNVILKNFDATSVRPLGQFKCFLHWKGKYYCITMEVMDSDETPNILCREQTFFMNILKPCFTVQKDNSAVNMTTAVPNTIPPEALEMQSENNTSSEQIIPVGEPNRAMNRTEEISSSHSGTTDLAPNTAQSATVLSVHSKPTETTLRKESVLKNYSDIFQGLGKFPGEPYKLRLKPDSTQAKHRPKKVPLHLQDAFHEEVKRLVKIDVLELVNEPTEWVNSFMVVEKQVNTSNAHRPGHSIKKNQLCIDAMDNNDQQVVLHPASRKQELLHTASMK